MLVPMIAAMLDDPKTMRQRARAIDAHGHGPRSVLCAVVAYLRREQEQAFLAHVWGEELLLLDDEPAAPAIARAVCRGLDPAPRSEDANHYVG